MLSKPLCDMSPSELRATLPKWSADEKLAAEIKSWIALREGEAGAAKVYDFHAARFRRERADV